MKQLGRLLAEGTLDGQTDARLLERFHRDRDELAFAMLVARHGPTVLAACRGLLREPSDAEDAFQATFLVLARKAGTLRVDGSLAGWLHRIAYRIALQAATAAARRRRVEAKAAGGRPIAAEPVEPRDDLAALVRSEVARLPERLRLPVLLCDLGGLSRPEAAERLSWTEGTLRGRLTKARAVLRDRLARRGLAGAALASATAPAARAAASLPPTLLDSTVRLAAASAAGRSLGGVAASALAAEALRSMMLTRLKSAGAAVLALGLGLTASTLAAGLGRARDGNPAALQDPPSVPAPVAAPAPADEPADSIVFRGRVLGPDGRPIAGVPIRVVTQVEAPADSPPPPSATSGPDGSFRFEVAREAIDERVRPYIDQLTVLAAAEGFGVAWTRRAYADESGALTLQLVEDSPIEGRLLDLEGRPVAGATVRVERIESMPGGSLDWALERLEQTGLINVSDASHFLFAPAWSGVGLGGRTDEQGRFRLEGVGRERLVRLTYEGPGITRGELQVFNRPGMDAKDLAARFERATNTLLGPSPYRGPRFDEVVAPGRAVEGVVRDAGTGEPIAGIQVSATPPAGGQVRTETDAEGRYSLAGLPKVARLNVYAYPGPERPYLFSAQEVADAEGLGPITLDWDLERGTALTGKVVEAATGKPVPGSITYRPLAGNDAVIGKPGGEVHRTLNNSESVAADGTFRVVVPPGLGAVFFQAQGRRGQSYGYDTAPAVEDFLTARRRVGDGTQGSGSGDQESVIGAFQDFIFLGQYHAYAVVEPESGQEALTVDLEVRSGRSRRVRIIGPDGEPATAVVSGAEGFGQAQEADGVRGPEILVRGLDPDRPRTLVARSPDGSLGGLLRLRGDEPEEPTLKLAPTATLVGRLLDADGEPLAGARILGFTTLDGLPTAGPRDVRAETDAEGRFRLPGLLAGLPWGLAISTGGTFHQAGPEARDLTLEPGESRDLGDLKAEPVNPPPASP